MHSTSIMPAIFRSIIRFVVLIVPLVVCSDVLAELNIEGKPRWGFDGTIRVEEFNLLTVEVFNNSEKPWQGSVWAKPVVGIQPVDVPVIQPDLFIEPYGKRQLQFHLFVPNQTEYEISWGKIVRGFPRAEGRFLIDSPLPNYNDLLIQLVNDDSKGRSREIPSFHEQSFPASASVLRTLKGVVLDHVPRWQNPQTQAFRDWLYGGGTLYLVPDVVGTSLEFPEALAELNEPSDRFPVGYGVVIRSSPSIAPGETPSNANRSYKNLSTSGTIFSLLKSMTTPDHNWSLIYVLAVIYLLVLFPGCWLIGRKKGDFRLTYAVILGTVGLFSFGFHAIGKRGYGETTTINSVAIARPGQPGRWVVKQWSNLFITTGGDYLVSHNVDSSAVSTGQHTEAIRGMAMNQPTAALQSDIPSFSNRTILHTGTLKAQGLRPQVKSLTVSNRIEECVLTLPEGENWPPLKQSFAIYQGELYPLNEVSGELRMVGSGQRMSQLNYEELVYNPYRWRYNTAMPAEDQFDRTFWLMVADDLGQLYGEGIEPNVSIPPHNLVRVYLLTAMEPEFFAQGDNFPQQNGNVLYCFDLHPQVSE